MCSYFELSRHAVKTGKKESVGKLENNSENLVVLFKKIRTSDYKSQLFPKKRRLKMSNKYVPELMKNSRADHPK